MFSRTVIDAKVAATWNVRPTPRRQCRAGRAGISSPAQPDAPGIRTSWPLMQLKQVVLPAPLGPISAQQLASGDANETSRTARTPSKDLVRSSTSTSVTAPLTALALAADGRSRASAPPMPCGNSSTMARITAPVAARQ